MMICSLPSPLTKNSTVRAHAFFGIAQCNLLRTEFTKYMQSLTLSSIHPFLSFRSFSTTAKGNHRITHTRKNQELEQSLIAHLVFSLVLFSLLCGRRHW